MISKNAKLIRSAIVEKWIPIREGIKVDRGASDCKLCDVYYLETSYTDCPIYKKTGRGFCKGTPYAKWCEHHKEQIDKKGNGGHSRPFKTACKLCRKLAQEEIYFLWDLYLIESQRPVERRP